MSRLRARVNRWLHGGGGGDNTPKPRAHDDGTILLNMLSAPEAPGTVTAVAIRNGFLVCRRNYNSNGPDKVEAVFAKTAEDLGPLIIAELAMVRLTK